MVTEATEEMVAVAAIVIAEMEEMEAEVARMEMEMAAVKMVIMAIVARMVEIIPTVMNLPGIHPIFPIQSHYPLILANLMWEPVARMVG